MSRYVEAKAELERALLSSARPRARSVSEPVRYAAITVMQPYAWLIAHASAWPEHVQGKTLENRSRATSYRGPVLIHVSRRWQRVAEQLDELRRLGLIGRGCPEPELTKMRSQLGLVIAVGELVGCRRIGASDPHPWAHAGAWGWELAGVELVQPFGLRGHTGLWYAPAGVRVRTLAPKLELAGLPASRAAVELGLRVDATTGTTSIKVRSFVEAARVLLRLGVRRSDDRVLVNGAPLEAGRVLARAAAEHGDADASERLAARLRSGRIHARPPESAARGPRLHGCEPSDATAAAQRGPHG